MLSAIEPGLRFELVLNTLVWTAALQIKIKEKWEKRVKAEEPLIQE